MADINWDTLNGSSPSSNAFCEFICDCNLSQLINTPTHIHGNILDLLITNVPERITNLAITNSSILQSDHSLISFSLPSTCHVQPLPTYTFNFKKADLSSICSFLFEYDFQPCFSSKDVDFVWQYIKQAISQSVNLFVPYVKLHSNLQPKWFSSTIRHNINCLKSLKRSQSIHPTDSKQAKISKLEISLDHDIQQAKSNYEASLISDRSSSKIYKHIRNITKLNSIPPLVYLDSLCSQSDSEKATLFNQYFYSVFSSKSVDLPSMDDLPLVSLSISSIEVSEHDVYSALSSLDPDKAMGIDGISPLILKTSAVALYQPIHHLFNLSLHYHYLPSDWTTHSVTPVFKSGDRSSVKNYRPISLLCIISKVLERIIFNKIVDFITPSIPQSQFGFLRGHSSLQHLLIFIHNILLSIHSKCQLDTIYLKLSTVSPIIIYSLNSGPVE